MMNSNATHKIAVGIGLAAVFGLGVSVFAVRAVHESQIARSAASAGFDQNAADGTAPASGEFAQMPTEQVATPSNAPPPVPPVAAPTSIDPANGNVAKASDRAERRTAKPRSSGNSSGTAVAPVTAPAADSNPGPTDGSVSSSANSAAGNIELTPAPQTPPAPTSPPIDSTPPAPAGATADTQPALAQSGPGTATGSGPLVMSNDPAIPDSQITAYVMSEIALAAPTGKIEVTTTNGIVALAGSVPSQDAADQVRLVAQRVAGVKQVDVSALVVSNQ